MKKFRTIVCALCAAALPLTAVCADPITAVFDKTERSISVNGDLGKKYTNSQVMALIVKEGTALPEFTADDFTASAESSLDDVVQIMQLTSDNNGGYECKKINNPTSGKLTVYVAADGMSTPAESTLFVPSENGVNTFLSNITGADSGVTVHSWLLAEKTAVETYADTAFGADITWYKLLNEPAQKLVAQAIYNNRARYTGSNGINNLDDDIYLYSYLAYLTQAQSADELAKLIDIENSGYTAEAQQKIKRLLNLDTLYTNSVFKYLKSASATDRNGVLEKVRTKDLSTPELLTDALYIGTINYKFGSVNGWRDAYTIMNDHIDVLTTIDTSRLTVYANTRDYFNYILNGKDYATVEALCTAANTWSPSTNQGGGTYNGNAAAGGGGGGSSSIVSVTPSTSLVNNNTTEIFGDLANHAWAKTAIENLYAKGIVSGVADKEFDPAGEVTREQFVKMIVATFGIELTDGETDFADVDPDAWYAKYVKAAVEAGIVYGITEDTFGVGMPMTRQDMAVTVCRAVEYKELANTSVYSGNKFGDDDEISDYAKDSVSALRGMEIVSGRNNNEYAPLEHMTRAESAVIMNNVVNKFKL